jgi:hypothetical protein
MKLEKKPHSGDNMLMQDARDLIIRIKLYLLITLTVNEMDCHFFVAAAKTLEYVYK